MLMKRSSDPGSEIRMTRNELACAVRLGQGHETLVIRIGNNQTAAYREIHLFYRVSKSLYRLYMAASVVAG